MKMINKMGLAASLVLASGVASAASYDLYDHAPDFAHTVSVFGSFEDVFSIVLGDNSTGSIVFSALNTNIGFSSLVLEGNGVTLDGAFSSFMNNGFVGTQVDLSAPLASGTYSITLAGNTAFSGAGYTVNNSFTAVSPVPEPSSIALMLGGLGLVGFMAARRSKKA